MYLVAGFNQSLTIAQGQGQAPPTQGQPQGQAPPTAAGQTDCTVTYSCSCGTGKLITELYFCRHCQTVRCSFCIQHEVDTLYCATCFENMPSSEARLKKNRCGSCMDCPSCFHTLSTRATSLSQARGGQSEDSSKSDPKADPKTPKKMYYLSCLNCRWTSRDVGMPDQPIATGGWPEKPSVYSQRIVTLLDHYKALAMQEKQSKLEKEKKKYVMSGKYMTLTDKIGLTSAMARARISGTPSLSSNPYDNVPIAQPAVPISDPDDLPSTIFTKEVKLSDITNMEQRLSQPEYQPATVENLFPSPKQLSIKRSQRCRRCDHNVTKPEYNPGSIKFKIQLFAYYHIPEVRVISCEYLKPGQPSQLILKLSNPTGHDTTINFLSLTDEISEAPSPQPESIDLNKIKLQEVDNAYSKTEIICNSQLVMPPGQLRLPLRDDASEYVEDAQNYNDDPKIILWRKSNKLAVKMQVIPDENVNSGEDVITGFILAYTYTNTVTSTPRAPTVHDLKIKVHLNLGQIQEIKESSS